MENDNGKNGSYLDGYKESEILNTIIEIETYQDVL